MPRNKFPEQTRQRILDAAKQAFVEKGYENTTILDIVEATEGLTRGAFYHHFKSKAEVLDEISDEFFYANNPFEAVQNEEGLTGLQKLQKAIFSQIQYEQDPEYVEMVSSASAALYEDPAIFQRQLAFNLVIAQEFIQPLVEEGIEDGSIAPHDPRWLAELILLCVNVWTNPLVSPSTPEGLATKLMLVGELFDGIGFPLFEIQSIEAAQRLFDLHYKDDDIDFEELVKKFASEEELEERERRKKELEEKANKGEKDD